VATLVIHDKVTKKDLEEILPNPKVIIEQNELNSSM